jgi:hypothetical protein
MHTDCHALLKSVCALKGVTVSEYVCGIIGDDMQQLAKDDKQVRSIVMSGTYKKGTPCYSLKESLIQDLSLHDDHVDRV